MDAQCGEPHQREPDQLSGDYRLRYLACRGLILVAAAMYALASCGGQSSAAPSPTIEYRTPPGVTWVTGQTGDKQATLVPNPPVCPCEVPATETPIPTTTPTEVPIFKPAIVSPTTIQVSGQSLEEPTIVVTPTKWSSLDTTLTAAGWPSSLLPWAEGIIQRESGGDPTVSNYQGSGAAGWFQILPSTWADTGCVGNPFDALDNAVCAWRLYSIAGASPWAVP